MDLITFLFTFLCSLVCGVILTLIIQWYLFNFYIMRQPLIGPSNEPLLEPFSLPEGLLENKIGSGKESAGAVNALLQFLFQECRNTKQLRQWLRRRLSIELEELLTRTTTGKLFERIVLRDLNLGTHFPAMNSIEVRTLKLDPITRLIDEAEICLDIEYSGGFQLSIDASMRLSKTAHVSVKVNELSGQAMLKFSRQPYTHWCFCFYTEPTLQLSVESQFQGRSLPQINSIIARQIRKSLKKKHTLPFYKIRYKPFFVRMDLDMLEETDGVDRPSGELELTIIEVTRLVESSGPIFCSAAVDKLAWIEMVHSGSASYLTVDVTITKQSGQSIPIIFKQEFIPDKYQVGVVVDRVTQSNSSGWVVDLKPGDIILMVDGKSIASLSSLNKYIKSAQSRMTFRVERRLKSSAGDEKIDNLSLHHRKSSNDKTDSDSSNPPSISESPAKKGCQRGSLELSLMAHRLSLGSDAEADLYKPQVIITKDLPFSKVIIFNETLKFHVTPEHKYLNLSVWSQGAEKNSLLGHVSLPLSTYCPKSIGHHISTFSLFPPHPNMASSCNHPLSSHSGFEPCLCYGDVVLSFSFKGRSSSISGNGKSCVTGPPGDVIQHAVVSPAPTVNTLIQDQHDFVRTHFDRVTQCGFCFKKIWLKDALECQGCLMSCHKKCAPKCQAASGPGCARSAPRRPSAVPVQPEIVTTSPTEENNSQSGRKLSTLIASVSLPRGLKRAGSATSLAPPGLFGAPSSSSVSLPPTPNHSPSPSRKASLCLEGGALFRTSRDGGYAGDGNDGVGGSGTFNDCDDEINEALERVLSRRGTHDEQVMDEAKTSGRLLFADLPPHLRKNRIDSVMSKLKEVIDAETLNYQSLTREEQSNDSAETRAKIAFLIGKSEEKLQALTVLMLHCCAGLQDYQEGTTTPIFN